MRHTLTSFLTEIADALRVKKKTTEKIPARRFAAEIEDLDTVDISDGSLGSAYFSDTPGKKEIIEVEDVCRSNPDLGPIISKEAALSDDVGGGGGGGSMLLKSKDGTMYMVVNKAILKYDQDLEKIWEKHTGVYSYMGVATLYEENGDEYLFAISSNGPKLYCFGPNGDKIWETEIKRNEWSIHIGGIVVTDTHIFVSESHSDTGNIGDPYYAGLRVVDKTTKKIVCSRGLNLPNPIYPPTVYKRGEEYLVYGGYSGWLDIYLYDMDTNALSLKVRHSIPSSHMDRGGIAFDDTYIYTIYSDKFNGDSTFFVRKHDWAGHEIKSEIVKVKDEHEINHIWLQDGYLYFCCPLKAECVTFRKIDTETFEVIYDMEITIPDIRTTNPDILPFEGFMLDGFIYFAYRYATESGTAAKIIKIKDNTEHIRLAIVKRQP